MNLPHGILRFNARAVADGLGVIAAPASVLVRTEPAPGCSRRVVATLLACGSPADVDAHSAASGAYVVERPDCILIPGLVNAHTHLDLTHIGPQPFAAAGGFAGWADMIRQHRLSDPAEIAASVRRGVELNLAAGVVAVGDIAGAVGGKASSAAVEALRATEISGVSFVEFFAVGPSAAANVDRAIEVLRLCGESPPEHSSVEIGLSPHAPYSVSIESYRRAIASDSVPVVTHLAESPEERELIQHGRGPIRDLLERVGVWNDQTASAVGLGKSPARHMIDAALDTTPSPLSFVHLNDIAPDEIDELLGVASSCAIYCPRASEYFQAERHFGPHKYQHMMSRPGVGLAIGTDSIVNLPAGADRIESGQFGPLAEIRRLYRRDSADPSALLWLATMGGAVVLDLAPDFLFREADTNLVGLVAVPTTPTGDPLRGALENDGPPELLVLGTPE